ncbi:MAG: PEPxxWA-CTERM sorting domain-containing protein [Phenylobacterium sp.]|uniref:PEPxxWA-CTERM sorting domain-containing protein n=1 Tax=Phenylobacterium sp. TaxID=1871053 RepID=UPI00391D5958
MKSMIAALVAAASLSFAGAAHAVTIIATDADTPPPTGQQVVVDFDGFIAPGFSLMVNGPAAIFDGALGLVPGVAAPPPGTTSHYMAIQAGGSVSLLTPLLRQLSVYIGSPDSYNSIRFIGLNGYDVTLTGADLAAGAFNGDQSIGRRMTYDFGANRVTQVIFASSGNSFEFDNIAVGVVPEPGVWLLMIAGVGMVGAALRRNARPAYA